MEICLAQMCDLPIILKLYEEARSYMRAQGNPNQWGGGYPQEALLQEDIRCRRLYLCRQEEEVLGVFCFFVGEEPTYASIYQGTWCNNAPYGVLHRIAVSAHGHGVASFCYAFCLSQCGNLKVDTHRDNFPMQKSLAKNGFVRCGIIYLENGDERIAYQKSI